MSEKNKVNGIGESAAKRIKARSMLKKQRIAIISMLLAILLLVGALVTVLYLIEIYTFEDIDGTEYLVKKTDGLYKLCYKDGKVCDKNDEGYYQTSLGTLVGVDPVSAECKIYAVVDTEGSEELGYAQHVLMFKQLTYDISSTKDMSKVIKSIDVRNSYGGYTFERVGDKSAFQIKGHENTPFDQELFAQLAVACGYTISMRRLEEPKRLADNSIDYAEYGLVPETRVETVVDDEGNETEQEYEYVPVSYTITTMTGESHTVTVGDLTVTGTGYYAKYEGRDTVYVLASNNITATVMEPVESLASPMIVHPMNLNDYFNVANFRIFDNIDHDAIFKALEEKYPDLDNVDEEQFAKDYDEFFGKYSHMVCDFTFEDIEARKNTMNSYIPYTSGLKYADGYYINSTNVDSVLYELYETDFLGVVKLAPTDENFLEYGLDEAEYVISYYYYTTTADGKKGYVPNHVEVSKKTDDGVFYAYSSTYDMIVAIDESSFDFLEWEEIQWYDKSYIQLDISTVTNIKIESPEISVDFQIDDSASRYMTYFEQTSGGFVDGKKTYKIQKDAQSGKYILTCDGNAVKEIFKGDYMVTPLVYSAGVAQGENYLFVETKSLDLNSDGNNDATAYYFYNVVFTGEEFSLVAQISIADAEGNKLSDDRSVMGSSYLETDFYITNSSYLYLTAKDSYLGNRIEEIYGKYNRGKWGSGNLFVTADGKYVLVNSKTGEWSILDDVSCGFYISESVSDSIRLRAVEIPAKYGENGKITRYAETYYPLTTDKLQYDEASGALQVYNNSRKAWEKATYEDCTIGIWCSGAYYVSESGVLVAVNEKTGDWGYLNVSANELYVADIVANGTKLEYTVPETNHNGKITYKTAMENFQQFYKGLLFASFEGMAELDEETKASLRELDNFATGGVNDSCQLKITVLGVDIFGNRRDTVYRIYQYTERKSYITVETISYEDGFASSSTEAYGNFYILRSFADKIIEDAKKVVNGELVIATSKY